MLSDVSPSQTDKSCVSSYRRLLQESVQRQTVDVVPGARDDEKVLETTAAELDECT